MHRIDHPSAAASRPAVGAQGTPGYYQEANPGGGVPNGTVVTQEWLNDVQEGLVAGLIEAVGMTPTKGRVEDIAEAILRLIYLPGQEIPVAWDPGLVSSAWPKFFANPIGQVVEQADFPRLFAVIGTTFNTGGEGGTQFRFPDRRGLSVIGLDDQDPDYQAVGPTVIGSKTHTLTIGEMPSHDHPPASGAANYYTQRNDGLGFTGGSAAGFSGTTGNRGGGGAHENRQPSTVRGILMFTGDPYP